MSWPLVAAAAYLLAGLAVGYLCYRVARRDAPGGRLDGHDRWSVVLCGICWPLVLAALATDLAFPDGQEPPPLLLAVGLLLVLVAFALQAGLR